MDRIEILADLGIATSGIGCGSDGDVLGQGCDLRLRCGARRSLLRRRHAEQRRHHLAPDLLAIDGHAGIEVDLETLTHFPRLDDPYLEVIALAEIGTAW